MNQQFIRGLTIDWDKIAQCSYLRKIEAINGLEHLEFKKPITFLVGENESGKPTLLETIAVCYGFNPEGGTKNYSFSTYDSHSELCNAMRIEKGVRRAKGEYFAYSIVYKTKEKRKYDIDSVKISNPEGIEYLWKNLKSTEVAFKKITRPPELIGGEVWYEITDMQHIKSIQISDSGEVHTMACHIPQLSVVYSIFKEELQVLFERVEQI